MIVPAGFKEMSEDELIAALVTMGVSEDAAKHTARRLKGDDDDSLLRR